MSQINRQVIVARKQDLNWLGAIFLFIIIAKIKVATNDASKIKKVDNEVNNIFSPP